MILRNFLDTNGKLTAFPAKRKMKVYCLFYLAGKFEAGREYTEREVNELLLHWLEENVETLTSKLMTAF